MQQGLGEPAKRLLSKSVLPHRVARTQAAVSGIQVLCERTTFNSSNTSLKVILMVVSLASVGQRHLIVELKTTAEVKFG